MRMTPTGIDSQALQNCHPEPQAKDPVCGPDVCQDRSPDLSLRFASFRMTQTGETVGIQKRRWFGSLGPFLMMLAMLVLPTARAQAGATIYPTPEGAAWADDFQVRVDGRELFVHDSKVAAFACFSLSGKVHVAVTVQRAFAKVDVRPKSDRVEYAVENQTIHFDLERPCQLSIELDGDIKRPLFLFADPPEEYVPKPTDKNVRCFEAGKIHEAGEIVLKSNETLYIAGGAVVRGRIRAQNATNLRILGRGILDATGRDYKTNMVRLSGCTNVELNGVTLLNSFGWTLVPMKSENVLIDNVKIIGWRDNDDGIDIVGCKNLSVHNCFVRTKDDCIAVKASPGYFEEGESGLQDVAGVAVVNTVLWNAEWGNAVEIGFELQTNSVKNIVFKDCDVIHVQSGGVFTIHNGDFATVENIRYNDIRVEDPRDKLVEFRIGLSIYSGDCPYEYYRKNPQRKRSPLGQWMPVAEGDLEKYAARRGRIRNIHFENIEVTAEKMPRSYLIGYDDEEHSVENIVFENVRINDELVETAAEGNFTIENARGIRFTR